LELPLLSSHDAGVPGDDGVPGDAGVPGDDGVPGVSYSVSRGF